MLDRLRALLQPITSPLKEIPFIYDNLKFLGVLLLAYLVYIFVKHIILRIARNLIKRSKSTYDDLIFTPKVLRRLSYTAPLLILYNFSFIAPEAQGFLKSASVALIILFITLALGTVLKNISEAYSSSEVSTNKPIKGYLQILKIFVYSWGGIILVGHVSGKDVWDLLTGLGALTAVILLVFRDTILGLVASIQITWYNLVDIGDWVEVPKYNADGTVVDLKLHAIKIRNFDNTISIVPTYKLIEEGFKNWRGMSDAGARRVKKFLLIDIDSVVLFNQSILAELENYKPCKELLLTKPDYLKSRDLDFTTNLSAFCDFLTIYLEKREDIRKDLTLLVRPLQYTAEGLPLEITLFLSKTEFAPFEKSQAEIFDFIYITLKKFNLHIYQKSNKF